MSIELPPIKDAREQSRIPVEVLNGYRTQIKETVQRAILDHKVAVVVELVNVAEAPRVLNRLIEEVEYRFIKKGEGEKIRKKTGYHAYVNNDGVVEGSEAGKKNVNLTIEWGKPSEMTLELCLPRPDFVQEEEFTEGEDAADEDDEGE